MLDRYRLSVNVEKYRAENLLFLKLLLNSYKNNINIIIAFR